MEHDKEKKENFWSFDLPVEFFDLVLNVVTDAKILRVVKSCMKEGVLVIKDKVELQQVYDFLQENIDKVPEALQEQIGEVMGKIAEAIGEAA